MSEAIAGILHVVATPIGNLGDLSARAADILLRVDVVLAEDTRHTGRLLSHLTTANPDATRPAMMSLHDHNEAERVASVVARLEAGESMALVSDAGTPAVSDPGHRLVRGCIEAGVPVIPVPGPSAVLAALVGSGLVSERFTFEGFLPRKGKGRRERLQELATERRTMVLFVSPHRVEADLRDLALALGGERQAALARELTKLHEEFLRGSLDDLTAAAADGLRGEMALVIAGAVLVEREELGPQELARHVAALVASGTRSKDAIAEVAIATGTPKKVVYQAFLDFGAANAPT
ncbi:MAG: 16S rRNA (cytidine1402-2'-O)-methyltransferase [Glaciecola sp.]|jgi:16S rRNA (cytidine1402-2'-O)-methyltransferase